MNILMATNTFTPHVGGVARSVQLFSQQLRSVGHQVLVLAPTFDGMPEGEEGVVRLPAIQNFNNSQFSVPVALPGMLLSEIEQFRPDVVHCHHPFLLGSTALRIAGTHELPIVFTHHTRYETYTHYLPLDTPAIQRFVMELAAGFCNLCDAVVAPSQSVADMLVEHGVETRMEVIPTGVETGKFLNSDGGRARRQWGIPAEAFVVGHVGRLAPEKNLGFLAQAVAEFLKQSPQAHFLLVGDGPSHDEVVQLFADAGLADRLHATRVLQGPSLYDAYDAMDVFAFASQSETQGMVLIEAMATGTPVVAVDASGVRDVLEDGVNGRLLPGEDLEQFAAALTWVQNLSLAERAQMSMSIYATAEQFSMPRCAQRLLDLYAALVQQNRTIRSIDDSGWARTLRWLEQEFKLVSNTAAAFGSALTGPS